MQIRRHLETASGRSEAAGSSALTVVVPHGAKEETLGVDADEHRRARHEETQCEGEVEHISEACRFAKIGKGAGGRGAGWSVQECLCLKLLGWCRRGCHFDGWRLYERGRVGGDDDFVGERGSMSAREGERKRYTHLRDTMFAASGNGSVQRRAPGKPAQPVSHPLDPSPGHPYHRFDGTRAGYAVVPFSVLTAG